MNGEPIYLIISVDKWGNIVGYERTDDNNVVDKIDQVESNTGELTIAVKIDQLKDILENIEE